MLRRTIRYTYIYIYIVLLTELNEIENYCGSSSTLHSGKLKFLITYTRTRFVLIFYRR